jgi:methylphosphotriester-DNA--protein-cysteine methyltransferase
MSQFTTPSTRWTAIQSRNPEAASAFVYCVITTKIYCRPTCPSRLARRANVIFHDKAAAAAAEGFRACKRCRPELRDGEGDPQKVAVEKACNLVRNEQPGGEYGKWSVKALAMEVGLTESHFCRIFKKVMGMTVGEYRGSIFTGTTLKLSNMGQALEANKVQDPGESFPALSLLSDLGPENWLFSTDFNDSELEQDRHRFIDAPLSMTMFNTVHVHCKLTDSDQSSPDPSSDLTGSEAIDDDFRFIDFDSIHSNDLLI